MNKHSIGLDAYSYFLGDDCYFESRHHSRLISTAFLIDLVERPCVELSKKKARILDLQRFSSLSSPYDRRRGDVAMGAIVGEPSSDDSAAVKRFYEDFVRYIGIYRKDKKRFYVQDFLRHRDPPRDECLGDLQSRGTIELKQNERWFFGLLGGGSRPEWKNKSARDAIRTTIRSRSRSEAGKPMGNTTQDILPVPCTMVLEIDKIPGLGEYTMECLLRPLSRSEAEQLGRTSEQIKTRLDPLVNLVFEAALRAIIDNIASDRRMR